MDVILMELLWTMRTDENIMVFNKGNALTNNIITVRDFIDNNYYNLENHIVDFIKPEVCGGFLGVKERKIIEIYLK